MVFHVQERVRLHVAVEVYIWPGYVLHCQRGRANREIGERDALDTPVPPEILHERVAEEELCKGECVRVNDKSWGDVRKKLTPELNRHMLRYLTSRKSGHQDDYCGYVEDSNSRDAA